MPIIVCRPKSLPLDKWKAAARRAIEINPDNEAGRRTVARIAPGGGRRGAQAERRIAVLVARKWPATGVRLSVSFMDNPRSELRSRILLHMNAWGEQANVVFAETQGAGQVRIARLDSPVELSGYWSYIGTEILEAKDHEPTLNLEGFTMRTSEDEFRRVVRHEAGHTLGFEHEHMRGDIVKRIDRAKAIAYFKETDGWTPKEVKEQVLTPLSARSIMGTAETDPVSIMCYELPGEIMKDGKAVKGGIDINPKDAAFAASLYPKPVPGGGGGRTTAPPPPAGPSPAVEAGEADTFQLVVMDEFRPGQNENRGARRKPEFAQILATYAGARVTAALRLHKGKDGKPTPFGKIIGMHERIKAYTNREHGSLPDDKELIGFGGLLFETLLQGDVRRLYDEARTRRRGRRLDLVLTSMIPWISEKPWEFAFDTGRQSFLATEEIHFVRNVLTNVPADPVVRRAGPLRILVASAQPVGFGLLSIDQEVKVIRRGFEPLAGQGLVEVDVIARATPEQLHRSILLGAYQAVHFIGHGTYDDAKGEGCLIFENGRGGEYRLGERALREIFCKRGLSMVFLNACESGRGGRADFNKGVAQSLVAHGLPALVANQYSVLDASATSFAQHFYWSLAQGLTIGQSAREARIAVNYSLHGEPIDWAVPVLYARDPGMKLYEAPVAKAAAAASAPPTATAGYEAVVAVWDVDNVFPALDKTLAAMNRVQKVFRFELAGISAPLDVWDLNRAEGKDYLWADRVAERLKSKAAELGADVLVCVTRHWLRDDDWLNLYGWWPGQEAEPVLIISVAGFDRLETEGPEADRALANTMTTCLAGYFGDAGTHEGGARNCPLAFDRQRDLEVLTGLQRFDAGCRRRLAKKLGNKLTALDALLNLVES